METQEKKGNVCKITMRREKETTDQRIVKSPLLPGLVGEDREFVRPSRLPGNQSRLQISLSPRNSPLWPGLGGGGIYFDWCIIHQRHNFLLILGLILLKLKHASNRGVYFREHFLLTVN